MGKQLNYFATSFSWGVIAKLLDAAIKFLTLPLFLSYFGIEYFGLLTLAIATNAYLQLLDMGMNTGIVKFFSQWISTSNYNLLDRVARTNISFYLVVGVLNCFLLLSLGIWGESLFRVTADQFITFRYLLFILAAFSIINWITFAFTQLLIADEKIGFTQQMLSVRSILGLAVIGATLMLKWSIHQYFFSYMLINASIIIPYYALCRRRKLISSMLPAFYWKDFSVVFKYGLSILAMGVFQLTATHSRPLVLGLFSNDGVGILAEYRIIEVFPIFIISLGGMLISIFLPKASKAIHDNNSAVIELWAYKGTQYTSVLVALLCFPIILSAHELLILYVGEGYSHLEIWLSLWLVALIMFLHNTPIASLVLASGKTRILVFSTAIASITSVVVNALLCNILGIGSAVVGYLVYIFIQMSFYYFYFNSKVLKLNSMKVFKAFVIPTGLGFFAFIGVYLLKFEINSITLQIIVNTVIWVGIYFLLLVLFKVEGYRVIWESLNRR
jgi:O-antigen/teichoic acid export membrane protein